MQLRQQQQYRSLSKGQAEQQQCIEQLQQSILEQQQSMQRLMRVSDKLAPVKFNDGERRLRDGGT